MDVANVVGLYQLKINHSKTKGMGIGKCVTSPMFRVGGHHWVVKYYPQGNKKYNSGTYVSIFLQLQRELTDVTATFGFAMYDKQGNISSTTSKTHSMAFTSHESECGWARYLERTKLEETYVKDGFFVLEVSITAKAEYLETGAHQNTSPIRFPRENIEKFREENKQVDVIFNVDGTKFVAHRVIVAAQSPVFEAEFFGSMSESNSKFITIKETIPSVFKAMLDFMYAGLLPVHKVPDNGEEAMSHLSFLQNLLVVADRYGVGKLKKKCEHKLIESISLDTVLTLLDLAEKHNCSELKSQCLEFVVNEGNPVSLVFSEEYITLMQNYPSLLGELKEIADK